MSVIRRVLVYGVSSAASRLAAIVLVPLYVRSLSLEQFGDLELLLSIHALMVLLGGLQSESAVLRDYYEPGLVERPRGHGWNAVLMSTMGCAAACSAMLAAAGLGWLPPSMTSSTVLVPLMGLALPAQLLGVQLVMLRCADSRWRFVFLSFGDLVLGLGLTALFVVVLRMGVQGALLGLLGGKVIVVGLGWPWTFGWPGGQWLGWSVFRRMAAYGIPAVPAVFAGWVQNSGSRVILAASLGLEDVALAGLAIKVSSLFGIVVYSFRLAWEPHAMAGLSNPDGEAARYDRAMAWYIASMFVIAGLAILSAPATILLLTKPAYVAAGPLAALFIAGQFWAGLQSITSIGIHGARRTGMLLPVTAGGAALNTGVLLALAPWLGVYAAGAGFLAGSAFAAVLSARFSNRHYGTAFPGRSLAWTFVTTAVFPVGWILALDRVPAALHAAGPMLAVTAGGLVALVCIGGALVRFGLPVEHIRQGLCALRHTMAGHRGTA